MSTEPDWEQVRSQGRLVYWRRTLPDGGWLAVKKDGTRWHWTRRGPGRGPDGGGLVWYEGHRSSSTLARRDADRAVNDPDRYGPTDTCETCNMQAQECGHRRSESDRTTVAGAVESARRLVTDMARAARSNEGGLTT